MKKKNLILTIVFLALTAGLLVCLFVFIPRKPEVVKPKPLDVDTLPTVDTSQLQPIDTLQPPADTLPPTKGSLQTTQQEKKVTNADADYGYAESNSLNVLVPSKDMFNLACNKVRKNFIFSWQATNAMFAKITITDSDGNILEQRDGHESVIPEEQFFSMYRIKLDNFTDYDVIKWKIEVTFKNNKKSTRTGEINLIKQEAVEL